VSKYPTRDAICGTDNISSSSSALVAGPHLAIERQTKGTDQRIGDGKLRQDLGVLLTGFTVRDFAEDERVEKIAVSSCGRSIDARRVSAAGATVTVSRPTSLVVTSSPTSCRTRTG